MTEGYDARVVVIVTCFKWSDFGLAEIMRSTAHIDVSIFSCKDIFIYKYHQYETRSIISYTKIILLNANI